MAETTKSTHTLPSYIKDPTHAPKPADQSVIGSLFSGIKYTIQSFINDPFGTKGAAATEKRKKLLAQITGKYQHVLKENGSFKYNVYKVQDSVFIIVRVPSETVSGVTYDVAVEFLEVNAKSTNLLGKNIRIFSNNSAFAFTYAYVFNKQELLIPYFKSKLPEMSLTHAPTSRNPDEIVNYEKSIMFAMMFIRQLGLNEYSNYAPAIINATKFSIKNAVRSFAEVDQDYKMHKKMQMKAPKQAAPKVEKKVVKSANAARGKARIDKSEKETVDRKARVLSKLNTKVDNKVDSKVRR
jgi:hypothetical protein